MFVRNKLCIHCSLFGALAAHCLIKRNSGGLVVAPFLQSFCLMESVGIAPLPYASSPSSVPGLGGFTYSASICTLAEAHLSVCFVSWHLLLSCGFHINIVGWPVQEINMAT